MPRKKKTYRKINYRANVCRVDTCIVLHPAQFQGLKKIARAERKSVAWLVETALSDYFGVEVMLKEFKSPPLEAYSKD